MDKLFIITSRELRDRFLPFIEIERATECSICDRSIRKHSLVNDYKDTDGNSYIFFTCDRRLVTFKY